MVLQICQLLNKACRCHKLKIDVWWFFREIHLFHPNKCFDSLLRQKSFYDSDNTATLKSTKSFFQRFIVVVNTVFEDAYFNNLTLYHRLFIISCITTNVTFSIFYFVTFSLLFKRHKCILDDYKHVKTLILNNNSLCFVCKI